MRPFLVLPFLCLAILGSAQPTGTAAGAPQTPQSPHLVVYQMARQFGDLATAKTAIMYQMAESGPSLALQDTLATLFFLEGKPLQSVMAAKPVLEQQPQNTRLRELLAISYQNMGLVKEALAEYEELHRQTGEVYHLYQVGVLQFQLKRYGECENSLQKLIAAPASAEETIQITINQEQQQQVSLRAAALNVLGVTLLNQSQQEAAKKMFEQALAAQPDFALPKGNLEALSAAGTENKN